MTVSTDMDLKSDAVRGFAVVALRKQLRDVRAVAPVPDADLVAGLGILAQGAALRGSGEKLLRHRGSQLVGREVVRNRHPAPVLLDVGAVAADADDEPVAEVDRIDLTRVDLVQIGDEALQALVAVVAEVERPQPADALLVPRRRSDRGRLPSGQ